MNLRRPRDTVRTNSGQGLDVVSSLSCASNPAQQAAAIVLPNTEHAPVHIADVIVAIGKLRKAKMDTRAISGALGYAELEIKRLEALSGVHAKVLTALRNGRLKKDDLVTFVAEAAAERQWAPAALSWETPVEVKDSTDEDAAEGSDDAVERPAADADAPPLAA